MMCVNVLMFVPSTCSILSAGAAQPMIFPSVYPDVETVIQKLNLMIDQK